MKKYKLFTTALSLALLLTACGGGDSSAPASPAVPPAAPDISGVEIRVAGLRGPTSMGMVKLMRDAEARDTANRYQFAVYGTADEIVPKLITGELDIAALPCNLASVLYNKTQGGLRMAAVNTLGVLYIVENGDTIHSIADLRGRTLYSTGRGTTPEFALNYILRQNGLDPRTDLTIEFKSESTEVAALLAEGEDIVAMLPQPYVSTVQAKNDRLRVALDLTREWDAASGGQSGLVTGVLVARTEFIEQNEAAFDAFLDEYRASTAFVAAEPDQAAALVAQYGIVPSQAVAKAAIPQCNIVCLEGDEMRTLAAGYLSVLFEQDPTSVGGALPDDAFYHTK